MSQTVHPPIKPIYSKEQMEAIISRQPILSSEECFRRMEAHFGAKMPFVATVQLVNGRHQWVS